MVMYNRVTRDVITDIDRLNIHKRQYIRSFFHGKGYKISLKNVNKLLRKLIFTIRYYRVQLKGINKYIKLHYYEDFKGFLKYNNDYSIIKAGRLIMNGQDVLNNVSFTEMDDLDSIIDNILEALNALNAPNLTKKQKSTLIGKIELLMKVAYLIIKKYETGTRRIQAMVEYGGLINDANLLRLEAAIINGDQKTISDFIAENKNKILEQHEDNNEG